MNTRHLYSVFTPHGIGQIKTCLTFGVPMLTHYSLYIKHLRQIENARMGPNTTQTNGTPYDRYS